MEILPNQRQIEGMNKMADSYTDARIFDVLKKLCRNVDELQRRVESLEKHNTH